MWAKIATIFLLSVATNAFSQESRYQTMPYEEEVVFDRRHEVGLAGTYIRSFESNLYNDGSRVRVGGAGGFEISYRIPLGRNLMPGISIAGMFESIDPEDSGYPVALDLNLLFIGLSGKWIFGDEPKWRPYALLQVNYVVGDLTDYDLGILINSLRGYSMGAGAGIENRIVEGVSGYLQVAGQFGDARWREEPSDTAVDRTFNTGSINISLGLLFRFQTPGPTEW